jgi:hypothetical protein
MDEGQADRDSIATVPDEALKRSEVGRLLETTYRNYVAVSIPSRRFAIQGCCVCWKSSLQEAGSWILPGK